jgi:hypothetical protein
VRGVGRGEADPTAFSATACDLTGLRRNRRKEGVQRRNQIDEGPQTDSHPIQTTPSSRLVFQCVIARRPEHNLCRFAFVSSP